jgi:hypothetical protein
MWHSLDTTATYTQSDLSQVSATQSVKGWIYLQCNHSLGARAGWMSSAKHWLLYSHKRPNTHCIGGLVGFNLPPNEIQWSQNYPAHCTSLYWLHYPSCPRHIRQMTTVDLFFQFHHTPSGPSSNFSQCTIMNITHSLIFFVCKFKNIPSHSNGSACKINKYGA